MRKTMLMTVVALFLAVGLSAKEANQPLPIKNFIEFAKPNQLCNAIISGDIDMVVALLEQGEDVNKRSLGMTPSHYAARYNQAEILKVLIKNGANLQKRCKQGYTVKKYAELSNAKDALAVINAMKK